MYKWIATAVGTVSLLMLVLAQYWSFMPDVFNVQHRAVEEAKKLNVEVVTGFTTTHTLIEVTNTLLHKPRWVLV
ncbi:DUF2333 family protein [Psychrosphaera algicola]|uniref:DUF2333 family protein n=1 Tax=Psychrosphaera algicola TaxID=3023714 RepID=UPI00351D9F27